MEVDYAVIPSEKGKRLRNKGTSNPSGLPVSDQGHCRVQATTDMRNKVSQGILEKVGFKGEGPFGNQVSSEGSGKTTTSMAFFKNNGKNQKILTRTA